MVQNDLTDAELNLFNNLPGPPPTAEIRATNVWIVEWLYSSDTPTGQRLHEWMKEKRPGWSCYFSCQNKAQVMQAIGRAIDRAQQSPMMPILHLESHGGNTGLEGTDGFGSPDFLSWEELTDPLQELNVATRCNLLIFVAACSGFAGIQALNRGPRAPANVLVGPVTSVMARNLLEGTKEFYRRWMDKNPKLEDIAESASREAGQSCFQPESFVSITYEALVKQLIKSIRPDELFRRKERIRQSMLGEGRLSASEIEHRLADQLDLIIGDVAQQIWDKMFMIDLYPENRERFGVDMRTIMTSIIEDSGPSRRVPE